MTPIVSSFQECWDFAKDQLRDSDGIEPEHVQELAETLYDACNDARRDANKRAEAYMSRVQT